MSIRINPIDPLKLRFSRKCRNTNRKFKISCFMSRSGLDPDSIWFVDPDPVKPKFPPKKNKKREISMARIESLVN
jgi:hypothetical protein